VLLGELHLTVLSNLKLRFRIIDPHGVLKKNPVSQPSLDISPIWIPLISNRATKSKDMAMTFSIPYWFVRLSLAALVFTSNLELGRR
jgi:hypothetical protein